MGKEEIQKEDCPDGPALKYPGKWSKDNTNGTILSKRAWMNQEIEKWVRHCSRSPKYENTRLAHKYVYLTQYLKTLKVKRHEARAALIEIEEMVLKENVEENVEQCQGTLGSDIEMTVSDDSDSEEEVDNSEDVTERTLREAKIHKMMLLCDEELFGSGVQISKEVSTVQKIQVQGD